MKILLLGDLHIGARNDSELFRNMMREYFKKLFYLLDSQNIKTIIQLGDILDKRQGISFITSKFLLDFFAEINKRGIEFHSILGNHDIYYKNTVKLAGVKQFETIYNGVHIYDEPTILHFDDVEFRLLPWITTENATECIKMLEKEKSNSYIITCGHFELAGFQYHKNAYCETNSFDTKHLNNSDYIISGHFHTPSKYGNIEYIGSPYKLTWNDFPDDKRVMVFDTVTKTFEDIINTNSLFYKIDYKKGETIAPQLSEGAYVKVITNEVDDLFDVFISDLHNKNKLSQVQIIDASSKNVSYEEIINMNIESPYEIIMQAIEKCESPSKDFIKSEITQIYKEAQTRSADVNI